MRSRSGARAVNGAHGGAVCGGSSAVAKPAHRRIIVRDKLCSGPVNEAGRAVRPAG